MTCVYGRYPCVSGFLTFHIEFFVVVFGMFIAIMILMAGIIEDVVNKRQSFLHYRFCRQRTGVWIQNTPISLFSNTQRSCYVRIIYCANFFVTCKVKTYSAVTLMRQTYVHILGVFYGSFRNILFSKRGTSVFRVTGMSLPG